MTEDRTNDVLAAKIDDAHIPNMEIPFTPSEAELLGAFHEAAAASADIV
jgi:hypothetical protein